VRSAGTSGRRERQSDSVAHKRGPLPAPALLALAVVLALKAVVLAQLHHHPLLQPEAGLDTGAYVELGRRVAGGDLALGPGPYYVAPLYAYFLGLVFALTGGSLLAAKVVQIALGTAAVGLIGLTAARWYGPRAGWGAAGAAALTGVFTFNEVVLLQSALDPFLAALSVWLLARALALGTRPRGFAAVGLSFGAFALNRPNVLLCVAGLAVALLATRRVRAAAAFGIGAALAVAPVTLRNLAVAGEPILISSHGGLNFYIGNNPQADGTYHSVPGITPSIEGQARDAQRKAERARGRPLTAREASDHFQARALKWMRSEPGAALRLLARKMVYVFNEADLALNYSYRYYSRDEPTLLRMLVVGPWLLVPLGVTGLVLAPRRSRGFWVWFSFLPLYAVSVGVFFVSSRYRLPVLVPLCIGLAGALELAASARAMRPRRRAAVLALAAALTVVALWDFGLDEGVAGERTEMAVWLVDQGRTAEAHALIERTARDHPQRALLLFRVGLAHLDRGDAAAAVSLLERARALDSGEPEIQIAFVRALRAAGREDEAIRVLESAARAEPRGSGNGAHSLSLAQLALELNQATLAEIFAARAARDGGGAAAYEKRGVALAMLGRTVDAVAALEEACRLAPASATAHLNLAVVLAQAGQVERARTEAREALRLEPGYAQAQGLLDALAP
jgi:tetratricopeptide (TPR) repeat protein